MGSGLGGEMLDSEDRDCVLVLAACLGARQVPSP